MDNNDRILACQFTWQGYQKDVTTLFIGTYAVWVTAVSSATRCMQPTGKTNPRFIPLNHQETPFDMFWCLIVWDCMYEWACQVSTACISCRAYMHTRCANGCTRTHRHTAFTMPAGTSPEFEMALYTIFFLLGQERSTTFIDGESCEKDQSTAADTCKAPTETC